jgi:hypothetical protein
LKKFVTHKILFAEQIKRGRKNRPAPKAAMARKPQKSRIEGEICQK